MEHTEQLVAAVRRAGRGGPVRAGSVVPARRAAHTAVTAPHAARQTKAISGASVAIGALVE
jgi:hypothetical protein